MDLLQYIQLSKLKITVLLVTCGLHTEYPKYSHLRVQLIVKHLRGRPDITTTPCPMSRMCACGQMTKCLVEALNTNNQAHTRKHKKKKKTGANNKVSFVLSSAIYACTALLLPLHTVSISYHIAPNALNHFSWKLPVVRGCLKNANI